MERIADLLSSNPKIALVCVISLKDRALVLRESRAAHHEGGNGGGIPSEAVTNAYLNLITTAALAFDAEGGHELSGATGSSSGSGGATRLLASPERGGNNNSRGGGDNAAGLEAVREEAWGLMRFRTPRWEISAFRQDGASNNNNPNTGSAGVEKIRGGGGGGSAGSSQGADAYLMVTFSDPSEELGKEASA